MSTNILSAKDIRRDWHLFDASGKILGRFASEVATKLTGKHKPLFVPYLDVGDFVVITNAAKIKLSGKKTLQKKYIRHSGFPGGYKEEKFSDLLVRKPEEVVRHAVKGMLPKNRLGRKIIKKLYVFPGDEHPFGKRFSGEK